MTTHRKNLTLLAAALTLLLASAGAQADRIELLRKASVQSDRVSLADLARLDGDYALGLSDLVIAQFVEGQSQIKLSRSDVQAVLESHQVHLGMISLAGQQQITIDRIVESAAVEPALDQSMVEAVDSAQANPAPAMTSDSAGRTLRELVSQYLIARANASAQQVRITWEHDASPVWQRTDGDSRFEIEPRNLDIAGRIPLTVRQYRGDELIDTLSLGAVVEIHSQVVIAARPVSRGQTLVADDLRSDSAWLSTGRKLPLTDIPSLVGQVASRPLQAGQMLVDGDVKPALMVRRGQLVTLHAISGEFSIKTVGRAMSDGRADDLIEVRHPLTQQVYSARVSGPQQAVMLMDTKTPQDSNGGGA